MKSEQEIVIEYTRLKQRRQEVYNLLVAKNNPYDENIKVNLINLLDELSSIDYKILAIGWVLSDSDARAVQRSGIEP